MEQIEYERLLDERNKAEKWAAAQAVECYNLKKKIASLFDAIAHGDEEHRAWLKKAITDHFNGKV